MGSRIRQVLLWVLSVLVAGGVWFGPGRPLSFAAGVPSAFVRSFAFPASFANGLVGHLVPPIGTASRLSFETAHVAVGELPIPIPLRAGRRGRTRSTQKFARLATAGPHARLLLTGVVDADGSPVTNSGNQLIIDAVVSPSGAATTAPPYTIPFDITDGTAFVDAALPIQRQVGETVNIQVLGISAVDPDGQPFGVLGFTLAAARPTPTPRLTPTPGEPPQPEGACFVGANCTGPSFPSAQSKCCRIFGRPNNLSPTSMSWCPPDQFDAGAGQCAAGACVACVRPPPLADCGDRPECAGRCMLQCADGHVATGVCQKGASCACNAICGEPPTPTPGPCANAGGCGGSCELTCPDGTVVTGKCTHDPAQRCACSATCSAPTPCSAGQCFDTITGRCTGHPCRHGTECPLPNQFCDVGGRRCSCESPSLPHGRICCQCKDQGPECFELQFAEAQPICPMGCESFFGQECNLDTGICGPPTPCTSDKDCDDGNGCTIDRCTPDGCTHDCVCVGPAGCRPGPAVGARGRP